jgi:Outer membrane lipoprotein-sorting protein
MKKYLILVLCFFFTLSTNSLSNQKIINHFKNIKSLEFKFTQRIDNNNIEKGEGIISYPKKILGRYNDLYNKVLVSNGKSLVINSDKIKNYYRNPLDKTPLNIILDKKFLLSKKEKLKEDETYPFYYVKNLDKEKNLGKGFFRKTK